MKKLLLFFFALLASVSTMWAVNYSVSNPTQVTDLSSLSADKFYVLQNQGGSKYYNYYDSGNSQMSSKASYDISCVVRLNNTGEEGEYSIQQVSTGTYYQTLSDGALVTLGASPATYSISEQSSGIYFFDNNNLKLNTNNEGNLPKGANKTWEGAFSQWKIFEVDINCVTKLSDVNANKCYTVTCNRSAWAVAKDGTALTTIAKLDLAASSSDTKQQFAFVTPDEGSHYYLYSVGEGKYLTSSNSLTTDPTVAEPVYFADASSFAALTVRVYFNASKNINVGGSNQITIDTWATADAGCAYLIEEAGDFDPTAALEIFSTTVNVTYALYESDGETFVSNTVVVQEKNSAVSIPSAISSNTYFDYSTSGTIGTSDCTITVTRTPKTGIVYPLTNLSNSKKYSIKTKDNARSALSVYNGYLASPVKSALSISPKDFAILSYEGNYYLYSVDDEKFVTYENSNNAPLATCITGTSDRIGFSATTAPLYELRFDASDGKILNSSSSYAYGIVINGWGGISSEWDDGCQYSIEEAGDFDPDDAIAVLEDFFHPTHTITYVVKDNEDNTLFTSDAIGAPVGTSVTEFPAEYKRPYFYTYGDITPVTITGESSSNTNIEIVATHKSGVLEYTATTSSPIYYNLNIRSKYLSYDTNATGDVGLANTSDPFNPYAAWAFIGDPYTGFKIINQQKGTDYDLTYTSVITGGNGGNNNIQFVADEDFDNRYWYVEANNGGICLRMKENMNIYFHHDNTNQLLRTCSVREWGSVHNDPGSTIVFDSDEGVLQSLYNELKYVYFGANIGQYTWGGSGTAEEAKSNINGAGMAIAGQYTSMYKALYDALLDIKSHITLNTPSAGFYRLKNKATGKYLTTITATDSYTSTARGVYANGNATDAATVIRLFDKNSDGHLYMYNQGYGYGWVDASRTGSGSGGVGYAISSPDKYVNWLGGTNPEGGQIAFAICYGNGTGDYVSYLTKGIYIADTSNETVIGGTDYTADAAQWIVEAAEDVTVALHGDGAVTPTYYATLCAPFSYTVGTGTTAYTLEQSGSWLVPTAVVGEVAAGTPVLLKGTSSTATLTIGTGYTGSPVTTTALTGTYLAKTIDGSTDYVLGIYDGVVGFYHWDSNNLGANRAYFDTPAASVKGFIINWGDETGIENLNVNDNLNKGESIYNLAGQRVQKAQKGIYIVNGKKVLVK